MTNKQFLYREHKLTHYAWTRLRECERQLHAWAEDQCNYGKSSIDEEHWLSLARGTAARFRLKIYHQGDPRGCALYVYSDKEMEGSRYPIQQVYNTRATAIC